MAAPVGIAAAAGLHVGGLDNVLELSGAVSGADRITKSGGGMLVVSGTGSSFSGTVEVTTGVWRIECDWPAAEMLLGADTTLEGHGRAGALRGEGVVSPGPGGAMLRAESVEGSLGYRFGLPHAGGIGSSNDVLVLADAASFVTPLGAGNTVALFLEEAPQDGDWFMGGFFLEQPDDFMGEIENAEWRVYVRDGGGDVRHGGASYAAYGGGPPAVLTTERVLGDFGEGGQDGRILRVAFHDPEASTAPPAPAHPLADMREILAFRANWNSVPGATNYYLDVSTGPSFETFVSGYEGRPVGNVTTCAVTGLTARTTYYFRVRAENGHGVGPSSGIAETTTLPKQPGLVFLPLLTRVYDGEPVSLTAETSPSELDIIFFFDQQSSPPSTVGSYDVVAQIAEPEWEGAATGTLHIVEKPLYLIGAAAADKVYDGTREATMLSYGAVDGIAGDDDVDVAVLISSKALFEDAQAGTNKVVEISGLMLFGADAFNYTIGVQTTRADIAKADQAITLLFDPPERVVPGDTVAFSASASSGLAVSFAVTDGPGELDEGHVLFFAATGMVEVTASQAGDPNWHPAPDVPVHIAAVSLVSDPHPVVVQAYYGDTNAVASFTLALEEAEEEAVAYELAAHDDWITARDATNGVSGAVQPGGAVTIMLDMVPPDGGAWFVIGEHETRVRCGAAWADARVLLSVLQRPLLVTGAVAESKVYDGTTAAVITGGTLEGVVVGDDVELDERVGIFAQAGAGENLPVEAALTLQGADRDLYMLVQPTGLSAEIMRAALSIAAEDTSKTYGETDPAFTLAYAGFVNGEDENNLDGEALIGRAESEDAGDYALTPSGLTSLNYEIEFVAGKLTITPLEVVISLEAGQGKVYGEEDPPLKIGHGPLVGEDGLTGAPGREAGETVGDYAFTLGDLNAGGNYSLVLMDEPPVFTIRQATPGITQWPGASDLVEGEALSASLLGGGEAAIEGVFAFAWPGETPVPGTADHEVVFTPSDTHNWHAVTGETAVTVIPVEVWVDDNFDAGTAGWGVTHFAVVQAGIDAVAAGGVVDVAPGTYHEQVVIGKTLTLRAPDGAVLDGGGAGTVVTLAADGVAVSGFTVQNSGAGEQAGIALAGVSGCLVENNTVRSNSFGVAVMATTSGAHSNIIRGNVVHDNDLLRETPARGYGILLDRFDGSPFGVLDNRLDSNHVSRASTGIYLGEAAGDTVVTGNDVFENFRHGVQLHKSDRNSFSGNRIFNNGVVDEFGYDQSTGVRIGGGRDNTFSGNEVFNVADEGGLQVKGFRLFDSDGRGPTGNVITGNRIYGHAEGESAFLYGIQNIGYDYVEPEAVDAAGNWWGTATGPGHESHPAGAGNRVSDHVLFYPWFTDEAMTRLVTSVALAGSRAYDGTQAADYSILTITNAQEMEDVALASGAAELSGGTVGAQSVVDFGTLALGGADALFYTVFGASGLVGITPLEVVISPEAGQGKIYGAEEPPLTFGHTPLVGEDGLTGAPGRAEGEEVGDYAFTLGDLAAGGNYTLVLMDEPPVFSITRRDLTVSGAVAEGKVYDGATDAIISGAVLEGVLGEDDVELDEFSGVFAQADAGLSVPVTAALTLRGEAAANYRLVQPEGLTADIAARELTVTADAAGKTYGEEDPALTWTITGDELIGEDALAGGLSRATGETVGAYEIHAGDLSAGDNYALGFVPADFTISPKLLTLPGIVVAEKIYDGGTNAVVESFGELAGVIEPDVVTLDAGGAQAWFATPEAGSHVAVAVSGLALGGDAADNYSLADPEGLTASILPRTLTVTADAAGKVYGEEDPSLTWSLTAGELVGEDAFTGALSRESGEWAGVYEVQPGSLSAGDNYALGFVPADFTISPKPLTLPDIVVADKVYDGGTNATVASYGELSGVIEPDVVTLGTNDAQAWFADANAGEGTAVLVEGLVLESFDAHNYILNVPLALTGNILRAAQVIVFDSLPPERVAPGDMVVLTASATSGGVVEFAVTAGPGELAGGHVLSFTATGVVEVTASQAGGPNWQPAPDVVFELRVVDLTPDPRPATGEAYYGDTNAWITFTLAVPPDYETSVPYQLATSHDWAGVLDADEGDTGLLNPGAEMVVTVTLVPPDEAALFTPGTLELNVACGAEWTDALVRLNVLPRPLTISAEAAEKIYGEADPPLDWELTSGGLIGDDALGGELAREPGEDAGTYAILQGTLDGDGLYDLAFVSANLAIHRAAQEITGFLPESETVFTTASEVGLSALSSAGLPVHFAIAPESAGIAILAEGTNLTFGGTGIARVVAVQEGGVNHLPVAATNVFHVYVTIIATAGPSGAITPAGAVYRPRGSGQLFSIAAAPHYRIQDILANGESIGVAFGNTSREFDIFWNNLTDDATLHALFSDMLTQASPVPVPHEWLAENFPDAPDFEALVLEDADGDGMTIWQEYIAGTDPNDPGSALVARAVRLEEGPGRTIYWLGTDQPDRVYNMYRANDLAGEWTRLAEEIESAHPEWNVFHDETPPAGPPLFYRIKVILRD